MAMAELSPAQLLSGVQEIAERCPDAVLVKARATGNLAIMHNGEYIGYLDLRDGEVTWME